MKTTDYELVGPMDEFFVENIEVAFVGLSVCFIMRSAILSLSLSLVTYRPFSFRNY